MLASDQPSSVHSVPSTLEEVQLLLDVLEQEGLVDFDIADVEDPADAVHELLLKRAGSQLHKPKHVMVEVLSLLLGDEVTKLPRRLQDSVHPASLCLANLLQRLAASGASAQRGNAGKSVAPAANAGKGRGGGSSSHRKSMC